jgi:hypothetical protein
MWRPIPDQHGELLLDAIEGPWPIRPVAEISMTMIFGVA